MIRRLAGQQAPASTSPEFGLQLCGLGDPDPAPRACV